MVTVAESPNDPVFGVQVLSNSQERRRGSTKIDGKKRPLPTNQTSSSFATSTTKPGLEAVANVYRDNPCIKANLCPVCSNTHDLSEKKTMAERKSFLYEKMLCFACYGIDHVSIGCVTRRTCKKCKKRHPTALRLDGFTMSRESAVTNPSLRTSSLVSKWVP